MEDASISSFGSLSEILTDLAELDPNMRGAFSLDNTDVFKETLATELGVNITDEELRSCKSLDDLTRVVYSKLEVDASGNSMIDVFTQIESIAKSELHHSVHLRWFAEWREYDSSGNWFTKPDWLDYFEMFDRIREELGADLGVTTKSFEQMPLTVGETVKRVWRLRLANASSQSTTGINK
ncbi:MAG: hypothetical protein ACK4S4_06890 [Pyrinomonadaceae bacterium]